jgi:hypothetical protein
VRLAATATMFDDLELSQEAVGDLELSQETIGDASPYSDSSDCCPTSQSSTIHSSKTAAG